MADLILTTDGGSGRLTLRPATGQCAACGRRRSRLVDLDPGDVQTPAPGTIALCGTCLAAAAAIALGRAHVQSGGEVGDLDSALLDIERQVEGEHPDWSPAARLDEARRRRRQVYRDAGDGDDLKTGTCATCHRPMREHDPSTLACPPEAVT